MAEEKKESESTASAPASAAPASGGGSKIILALTAVNLLLTVGVGGVLFMNFSKQGQKPALEDISTAEHGEAEGGGGEHGEAAKADGHGGGHGEKKEGHGAAETSKFGKIVALEEFTVNLATTGSVSPKYARVNISIEVPSNDVEAEVNHKVPQIRNTIIDLFNAKRPTDLATGEGRTHLKEEIKGALNTFMVTGKIKGVFFTSFAVSS